MGWQRNYWSRSWRSPWQVVVYRISPSMPSSGEQRTSSSSGMYRTGRDSNRRSLRPSLGLRVLNPACLSPYWKSWPGFTSVSLFFPSPLSASTPPRTHDLEPIGLSSLVAPGQVFAALPRPAFDTGIPRYLSSFFLISVCSPRPSPSHLIAFTLSAASFAGPSGVPAELGTQPCACPCLSHTGQFSSSLPLPLGTSEFPIFWKENVKIIFNNQTYTLPSSDSSCLVFSFVIASSIASFAFLDWSRYWAAYAQNNYSWKNGGTYLGSSFEGAGIKQLICLVLISSRH